VTGTPRPTLLDAARIRRLRLIRGLSEREMAKLLGVTGAVVATLERGGNHNELPAASLAALAQALGVDVSTLFSSPAGSPNADDASVVGELLAGERRLVAVTTLAEALGWTVIRSAAAVEQLAALLPGVGMAVHRLNGDVAIVPAASRDTPQALATLARRSFARRGMTLSQARMLHRVYVGDLAGLEDGNASRVTLGSLLNADLVRHSAGRARGGRPQLSPDARDGLHHVLPDTDPGEPAPVT